MGSHQSRKNVGIWNLSTVALTSLTLLKKFALKNELMASLKKKKKLCQPFSLGVGSIIKVNDRQTTARKITVLMIFIVDSQECPGKK